MANPFSPSQYRQPRRSAPSRVSAMRKPPEELQRPTTPPPSALSPFSLSRQSTLPPQYQELTRDQVTESPVTAPPARSNTSVPPPAPPAPFLPNYGQDWLSKLGISGDAANLMALDTSRAAELASMLINAQYGAGAPMAGRFGNYLREAAGDVGSLRSIFDMLNIAGGSAERGGAYRTFEDMYESLGAGVGTGQPGQFSISDWRNMLYGGAGAANPGGFMGGGESVSAIPQGTLNEASGLLGQLRPLLGSTVGPERWAVLQNLLPDLFTRYNQETTGGTQGPMWLNWLQQGGYLPSRAL